MDKSRRSGMVFLILGIAFNTMGITNKNEGTKYTFIALGISFLVIAVVRLSKWRKENKEK